MGRKKYFDLGGIKRITKCLICGKPFKGDIRTVNEQLKIHQKNIHNTKYEDYERERVPIDITTGKFL